MLREYRAGVQEKFLTTGNERDKETGWDWRSTRSSDADNGRFNQVDRLAHLRPEWSPYRYAFCNPVRFSDPSGLYEGGDTDEERKKALANARRHKEAGTPYSYGGKSNTTGSTGGIDCSGLITCSIRESGVTGYSGNVGNIIGNENTTKLQSVNDLEVGNIIVTHSSTHTGIISDVKYDDKENVTKYSFIHAEGGKGENKVIESTVTVGEKNKKGELRSTYEKNLVGFYKWDTPDKPAVNSEDKFDALNTENYIAQPDATGTARPRDNLQEEKK